MCGILWDGCSESHSTTHIYNIFFCLKLVVQSDWKLLFNSRECDVLAWPCCVWLVAGDDLSEDAQCVVRCRAQVVVVRSSGCGSRQWDAWPTGPGSSPACSLGVVLMLVKQRYSLLGISEQRVFLEVSQTVYSFRLMICSLDCPHILISDIQSVLPLVNWWIW